jgi:hypothetical protein
MLYAMLMQYDYVTPIPGVIMKRQDINRPACRDMWAFPNSLSIGRNFLFTVLRAN